MSNYLSYKIKVMSFFSIILVLYIHSGFHDLPHEIQGMPFNFFLQQFISHILGRCAVPLFFAISGFLYFRGVNNFLDIFMKIKKRCKTLLIPYIISALILPMFYIGMSFLPAAGKFVNSYDIINHFSGKVSIILFQLYIDSGQGAPLAFHLWFLRDLIVIVFLSPLIYIVKEHINRYVLMFIMYLLVVTTEISLPSSVFWFLGGNFFLEKLSEIEIGRSKILFMLFTYLMTGAFEILYPSGVWIYLNIPLIILGLFSLWNLYNVIVDEPFDLNRYRCLSLSCSYTFFIYLVHEPALNIVRKLLVLPFGHTSFSFAFSYLISPWIFATIAISIGCLMKKFLKPVYLILTGGR